MAQDPWKRAHQLSRKQHPANMPQPSQRPRGGTARRILPALLIVALVAAAGVAAYVFLFRGSAGTPPMITKIESSEPVRKLTGKKAQVDQAFLEDGLGVGLVLFESYEPLLEATKAWSPGWQVRDTGSSTSRLEAPGIKAFAVNGRIETYDLDVRTIYSAKCWQAWLPLLRKAGLTPELAWTELSGEELAPAADREYTLTSGKAVHLAEGWAHRMFVLHFISGKLSHIEGRLSFGPADEPGGGH